MSLPSPKNKRFLSPASRPALVLSILTGPLVFLSACKPFHVKLSSPDPIKVDVNMRLDVYQYRGEDPGKPDAAQISYEEAVTRLRNRMAEVQKLKDNRLVGEDHRGLLHLREKPGGEWGTYVERTVSTENEDRLLLMRHAAQESNRALHEIQEEQWKLRTDKSFKGEWIEMPDEADKSYKWIQATGPKPKKDTETAKPKKDTEPAKPEEAAATKKE
ncbi:MAG: hypothetical protein RL693_606 [Verrucomicrobiota bacterium]